MSDRAGLSAQVRDRLGQLCGTFKQPVTPKRVPDMMMTVNMWLDRLSNWQFVVVAATCLVVSLAAVGCVLQLVTGHVNLSFLVPFGVVYTVLMTSGLAWKRWR